MQKLRGAAKVAKEFGILVCLECGSPIQNFLCGYGCKNDGAHPADRPVRRVAVATYRLERVEIPPPKPVST